jgi:hypothetical protein
MSLSAGLQAHLEALGLSQEDFAEVSFGVIQPSLVEAQVSAKDILALGVVHAKLHRDKSPTPPAESARVLMTTKGKSLVTPEAHVALVGPVQTELGHLAGYAALPIATRALALEPYLWPLGNLPTLVDRVEAELRHWALAGRALRQHAEWIDQQIGWIVNLAKVCRTVMVLLEPQGTVWQDQSCALLKELMGPIWETAKAMILSLGKRLCRLLLISQEALKEEASSDYPVALRRNLLQFLRDGEKKPAPAPQRSPPPPPRNNNSGKGRDRRDRRSRSRSRSRSPPRRFAKKR